MSETFASRETGAQSGDAARDLFERYRTPIYRFCLSQLRSREEAEDAVQTTFLRAFTALTKGVEPRNASAWLFKIAHNVCLSRRLSASRRRRVETPSDISRVPEEALAVPESQHDELFGLEEALADLSPKMRRVLLLREWQGLSYREIAAELGVSEAAVESLIFRARRELARRLEQPWERIRRALLAPLAGLKSLFAGGGAATLATAAASVAVVAAAAPAVVHRLVTQPAAAPPGAAATDVRPSPRVAPAVRAVQSAPAPVLSVRRQPAPQPTTHRKAVRHATAGPAAAGPAAGTPVRKAAAVPPAATPLPSGGTAPAVDETAPQPHPASAPETVASPAPSATRTPSVEAPAARAATPEAAESTPAPARPAPSQAAEAPAGAEAAGSELPTTPVTDAVEAAAPVVAGVVSQATSTAEEAAAPVVSAVKPVTAAVAAATTTTTLPLAAPSVPAPPAAVLPALP